MRLWKKVSGALKDKNSIFVSSLSRRTSYRNPDLEAAIIKATSHDETRVDYKNAQRVFAWIRTSTTYLKPLIWALSTRIEKTRSWVVAIKGLMLMHGVFFLKSPAVRMIGRLPFDLSNFKEGSETNPVNAWGYNEFIRAYFAFLDQKSAFVCMDLEENNFIKEKQIEEPMVQQLIKLQHFQTLLDMLVQIKPQTQGMIGSLVLEAMDCVIIEIFDVYSRICNGIARVLIRIYGAGKIEASMALDILQKAALQGEQLSIYFELCRDIGVLNASDFPKVEQIPEEDIRDLERIINGVSERNSVSENGEANEEIKALVVIENEAKRVVNEERKFRTIVTEKWEKFEEDLKMANGGNEEELVDAGRGDNFTHDLLGTAIILHPNVNHHNQEIPDLISF